MAVVLDASLLVTIAAGDPRAEHVSALIDGWLDKGEVLHAPALMLFEVANGLTRLVTAGGLPLNAVAGTWESLWHLPITYHEHVEGARVVHVARRLERKGAYDAAYLVLAQDLRATCWTLDRKLVQNASRFGFPIRLASSAN